MLPVTFSVTAAVPAVALVGDSEVTVGAGRGPGDVMEKFRELEFTADGRFDTEIAGVPSEVKSVGGIAAVS